ncbi:MAG: hypothetical protein OEW39_09555, partial [Deltaproteobacteria bacterium]|nr:hypothetical protein [Deltaproteobacteria bacterium]
MASDSTENRDSGAGSVGRETSRKGTARTGLATLLESGVMLSDQQQARLAEAYREGTKFYNHYNSSRFKLAYEAFDKEMRLATFEILFLLHVNHPKLSNFSYIAKTFENKGGIRRTVASRKVAQLYVPNAPAGVRGIELLPDFMRKEYESYIEATFGIPPYGTVEQKWGPIVSVQSVGSIGTVGHKTQDSDLDLQVMYDFSPFAYETGDWSDQIFKDAINREHKYWINNLRRQQNLSPEQVKQPEVQKKLSAQAADKVSRTYPGLFRYLVREDKEFATQLFRSPDKTLRIQMLHELLNLMKRSERLAMLGELKVKEDLLKKRASIIQDYLTEKFPAAEVYLFVYSAESFRQGQYSSTLEFKESSGSAYEMILNYDVLMPGIQFTPMVPTHFVYPAAINNDTTLFTRLVDYMRFGALDLFKVHNRILADLGPSPNLAEEYVAKHGGAIYWEAFKASSGNLPKAILNLFRIEMLLDKRINQTIIQIIKDPGRLNTLITPKPKPKKEAGPKPKSSLAIIQRAKAA